MSQPGRRVAKGWGRIGRYASVQEGEERRDTRSNTPHTGVNRASRRLLEWTQDCIVVGLMIVLFAVMVRTLWTIARDVASEDLNFRNVTAEVLFMLVLVELVRLLLIYLQEHHVAVDFMVELGIVSTLREVVLHGVVELNWQQIVALAVFLVGLGSLLRFGDLRPKYEESVADINELRASAEAGSVSAVRPVEGS